jgi:hypothetical protein
MGRKTVNNQRQVSIHVFILLGTMPLNDLTCRQGSSEVDSTVLLADRKSMRLNRYPFYPLLLLAQPVPAQLSRMLQSLFLPHQASPDPSPNYPKAPSLAPGRNYARQSGTEAS